MHDPSWPSDVNQDRGHPVSESSSIGIALKMENGLKNGLYAVSCALPIIHFGLHSTYRNCIETSKNRNTQKLCWPLCSSSSEILTLLWFTLTLTAHHDLSICEINEESKPEFQDCQVSLRLCNLLRRSSFSRAGATVIQCLTLNTRMLCRRIAHFVPVDQYSHVSNILLQREDFTGAAAQGRPLESLRSTTPRRWLVKPMCRILTNSWQRLTPSRQSYALTETLFQRER